MDGKLPQVHSRNRNEYDPRSWNESSYMVYRPASLLRPRSNHYQLVEVLDHLRSVVDMACYINNTTPQLAKVSCYLCIVRARSQPLLASF